MWNNKWINVSIVWICPIKTIVYIYQNGMQYKNIKMGIELYMCIFYLNYYNNYFIPNILLTRKWKKQVKKKNSYLHEIDCGFWIIFGKWIFLFIKLNEE